MVRERCRLDIEQKNSLPILPLFGACGLFLQRLGGASSRVHDLSASVMTAFKAHVVGANRRFALGAARHIHLFQRMVAAAVPFGVFIVVFDWQCHIFWFKNASSKVRKVYLMRPKRSRD